MAVVQTCQAWASYDNEGVVVQDEELRDDAAYNCEEVGRVP